jgi:hypothetical protein
LNANDCILFGIEIVAASEDLDTDTILFELPTLPLQSVLNNEAEKMAEILGMDELFTPQNPI